jgi:hypothetical protein
MGSFKQQAAGKVGKRWIPIGPMGRDSSPFKDSSNYPRALIMFHYGEK